MHQALYGPDRNSAPPGIQKLGFIEVTTEEPERVDDIMSRLGFSAVGSHRNRAATLYRQGSAHILVSSDRAGYARQFRNLHQTSACAFALHVDDAPATLEYAECSGAQRYRKHLANELDVNIPALIGPGHTLVYLMDEFAEDVFQQLEFKPASNDGSFSGDCGVTSIEQITLRVGREFADSCMQFYRHALGLHPGKACTPAWGRTEPSGLCLALESGTAGIDFELNDRNSHADTGEVGVIQLATADIHASVACLQAHQIAFARGDGRKSEKDHPVMASEQLVQKVVAKPGQQQSSLLRARTLPVLGRICIELVQTPAPH